ncbi:MAG TPA: RagB/SusD family nutrient uptake outer membrane protein, partial [Chitinophagaceae bacterium]|nr:RagB/SusD family nutrient uptake outer membrane protein [Chitinophagaceae bacterium]
ADNPAKADNIKGQALTIRAHVHQLLVNVYAQPFAFTADASHPGVPYIKESDRFKTVSRNTVAEDYTEMISDLKSAIALLPVTASSKTVVTASAAKGLLARTYLFRNDYINAKVVARDVVSVAPLMSRPDYPTKLFANGDTESLFWLPPTSTPYSTLYAGAYYAYYFWATTDIANLLRERPGDIRANWVVLVSGNQTIKKFPVGVIAGFSVPEASYYHSIIRSSEMYLTAAESYSKLGMEDSARYYLDFIRQRADLTAANSTATGSALLDSVYKERRKELCFEGLRMFDLLRTGKPVVRTDFNSPATSTLSYPNDKAIAPLPLGDVSAYSLKQNPSY